MSAFTQKLDRLRQVAILVASLDGPLAEQLLAQLSPSERRRVEGELERIDEIDSDERALVLAEFRGAVLRRESPAASFERHEPLRSAEGVEAEFSAESEAAALHAPAAPAKAPRTPLDGAEPADIVKLLEREHPQVVALVLGRLAEEQASAVFALLPPELQNETLDRLPHLDAADGELLAEVEHQLTQRWEDQQRRQARMAAGASLAMKMLAHTPPERRTALLARIGRPEPTESVRFGNDPSPEEDETPEAESFAPAGRGPQGVAPRFRDRLRSALRSQRRSTAAVDEESDPSDDSSTTSTAPAELTAALLALDEATLANSLASVGDRTAQLALLASGDELVRRLTERASRKQAAAFRKRLAQVGPTTLAEMTEAQTAVLTAAKLRQAASRRSVA